MCKKMLFGIKSEKRHQPADSGKIEPGGQLKLMMEVDVWGICQINTRRRVPEHMRVVKTITGKKAGGRQALPEGLEEEITVIDAVDRPANARYVRYEDQRQLASNPMRWYIKTTRRLVYLAAMDDQLTFRQLIAPLPPHPIPRCKFDVCVLVLPVTDKYLYHLPIWRQRQRFLQYGIDLSNSTLCNLTNRVWMWTMMNPLQRIARFLYQPGRSRKDIRAVLQSYKGYLLTDAYGGYTKNGRQPGVTHQHCLSHARWYFTYALENNQARATYALDHFFGPLYDIEDECKVLQLDYDGITEQRQAKAVSILSASREWLQAELPKTIKRTPIYKAISYTLNHYDALTIYVTDGMLQLDNNLLEGQIRAIALGRHNYLFAGSHRGGELAAIIYSFMATCKLQGIVPGSWLDDVLRRIPGQPEDKLIELLPQFWKPASVQKIQSA
jgi:hypothetical protein